MIKIENLNIDLGEFHLRDINLDIDDGEYMVLLGPTGAGKTVVVECIVGLHDPFTGRIFVGERNVVGLYPEERNVGYVPQDYALFPNMTVKENISYGLRARKMNEADIEQRVDSMMNMLSISHLHHRYPLNLSGGEKQRAALGRALVTEPGVLLLDEPLSALDENLRSELAAELREIQRRSGAIFLHVCHSFEEAADLADRIAIMKDGQIAQVGTIEDIISSPENLFVARFGRTRNFFRGIWDGDRISLDFCPAIEGMKNSDFRTFPAHVTKGQVVLGIRPEDVVVSGLHESEPDRCISMKVDLTSARLKLTHYELIFRGVEQQVDIIVNVARDLSIPELGSSHLAHLPYSAMHIFNE